MRGLLKNYFKIVAILTVATIFFGCAFGTRNIALRYEPSLTVKGANGKSIAIIKFEDIRENKDVGEVRNGYGMKTGKVKAKDQDVGAWVANALADELKRAGYNISKFTDAAPPEFTIAISGSVPEAYTKMFLNSRATVRANITVKKVGVVVLNKEYTGKASTLAWTASTGEYEKVLENALKEIMKQAVPEVIAAIQ
jgi:hypothetical protein